MLLSIKKGCSSTTFLSDGQLVLIEDSLTSDLAEEACLKLGGSLALLSTPYMKEYAKNILVYYDYDKAWSSSPNGEGEF